MRGRLEGESSGTDAVFARGKPTRPKPIINREPDSRCSPADREPGHDGSPGFRVPRLSTCLRHHRPTSVAPAVPANHCLPQPDRARSSPLCPSFASRPPVGPSAFPGRSGMADGVGRCSFPPALRIAVAAEAKKGCRRFSSSLRFSDGEEANIAYATVGVNPSGHSDDAAARPGRCPKQSLKGCRDGWTYRT